MAAIIAIIFIMYAYSVSKTIKKLREENENLKKQLNSINNNETNNLVSQPERQQTTQIKQEVEVSISNEEKQKNDMEKKNTNILITGAILIVLSAIVFLMSTWNSISNIFKIVVIGLLVVVFLQISKIADKKFKLKKTSNTFYYIAMAYIPIGLIACSIFRLFGNYFSIFGEGKYIYLTLSMILTASIYYLSYLNRKELNLLYASILTQIFAIILFCLIFANNILFISIILLLYNILLINFSKKIEGAEILEYFYKGIPYIVGIVALFNIFNSSNYIIVLLPVLAINLLLLRIKNDKSVLNAYFFNISLYTLGIYFTKIYDININVNFKIIISIMYTICVLSIEQLILKNKKDKDLSKSSIIIALISLGLTYFEIRNTNTFIQAYIVLIIQTVIMLITFIKSKQSAKEILGYLIPTFLVFTICEIFYEIDASYHFYIISSILIFIIGELIRNEDFKLLRKGFFIISHIFILITYVNAYFSESDFHNDVVYFILLELVYAYSFIKNRNNVIFKYLSYITSGFILIAGINFLELSIDLILFIPAIISSIILFIETKNKSLQDSASTIFNVILQVLSYICLIMFDAVESGIIALIYSVYLIYNNIKNEEPQALRSIPAIGLLLSIRFSSFEREVDIILLLLSTIAFNFISMYKKKISIDTILSGLYLYITLSYFNNIYVKEIFFFIWSFSNLYFMEKDEYKDIFKFLSYLGILLIYLQINNDLIYNYIAFQSVGIVIFAIAILKNIVRKYVKEKNNLDTIEYITFILIYLYTLLMYVNEKDGMIFVLFLVALLMFSYVKKYGVIFITSLFTILGNAILLTRKFWFSVPWWIYLLLVGGILIAFATKNESESKKKNIKVGNIIKNLKDIIEK